MKTFEYIFAIMMIVSIISLITSVYIGSTFYATISGILVGLTILGGIGYDNYLTHKDI